MFVPIFLVHQPNKEFITVINSILDVHIYVAIFNLDVDNEGLRSEILKAIPSIKLMTGET